MDPYKELRDSVSKTVDKMYEGIDPIDFAKRALEYDREQKIKEQYRKEQERNCATSDFAVKLVDDYWLTIMGYIGNGKSIVIPSVINGKKVRGIGYDAFRHNENLNSVTISEGINYFSIGTNAFCGCSGLTSITILVNNIELISYDRSPFAGCWNLKTVIISKNTVITNKPEVTKSVKVTDDNIGTVWPGASRFTYIEDIKLAEEMVLKEIEEVEKLHKEAELGNHDALLELSDRYRHGRGVSKDNEKAYNFVNKAVEHGCVKAKDYQRLLWKEDSLCLHCGSKLKGLKSFFTRKCKSCSENKKQTQRKTLIDENN